MYRAIRERQTPHRSRRKLRILQLEVMAMDFGRQAFWSIAPAFNECRVEDQLRSVGGVQPFLKLADTLDTAADLVKGCSISLHGGVVEVTVLGRCSRDEIKPDCELGGLSQ